MKEVTSQVNGFSKMTRAEKIDWLAKNLSDDLPSKSGEKTQQVHETLNSFIAKDSNFQKKFEEFSENTISNFHLPFGVAPNFLIDDQVYSVPMVIEESSVVAAAAKGAKFWLDRGGFQTEIKGLDKVGHVHFMYERNPEVLKTIFLNKKDWLLSELSSLSSKMEQRGGGILSLDLIGPHSELENYYQLELVCNTCDAMGANFINSLLEKLGKSFESLFLNRDQLVDYLSSEVIESQVGRPEIVMCILSNYTPNCRVRSTVRCLVSQLPTTEGEDFPGQIFAQKFVQACEIARVNPYRAVTHNKGILNGIDSVVLATGNDFRAVEAQVHAYAARDGQYRSLSFARVGALDESKSFDADSVFEFGIEIPLSIGTVGGLTKLHPLAEFSLDLLGKPGAAVLMSVIASVGLAQNFSAVRSLVTTGIQKGHMKMHLFNILNQLDSSAEIIAKAQVHFQDQVVSFDAVRSFVEDNR